MSEISGTQELRRARRVLRDLQAQSSDRLGTGSGGSVLPEAIEWLSSWHSALEAFASPPGSVLPYPQSRLLRTRRILERIDPGPLEHAQLLVTVAWQAAAIENELEQENLIDVGKMRQPPIFGTVAEPRSHAWTQAFFGIPVIVLSAGMIRSVYSLAKASVLSWPRAKVDGPPGGIAFSAHQEDREAHLTVNSAAADLLLDVVRNWLQWGSPQPTQPFLVAEELETPLASVVGMCDRFVLAHEYVHACLDFSPTHAAAGDPDMECRADRIAADCVVGSAGKQDSLDPDIALQGCMLAMAVHEIVDALLLMTHGESPPAQLRYPPFAERAGLILAHSQAALDMVEGKGRASRVVAAAAASAVHALWLRIADQIEYELRAGLTLHPMWTQPFLSEGSV